MTDSPIFLDTVGLVALWDQRDQWHAAALKAFQAFSKERTNLYTSSFVLLECANAAARRPYRIAVAALKREMEATGRAIAPTDEDWAGPRTPSKYLASFGTSSSSMGMAHASRYAAIW